KYGVSHPMKMNKFKKKVKNTNLKRYGVVNPTMNKDIRMKLSKTNSRRFFSTSIMNEDILSYVQPLFNIDEYEGFSNKNIYSYRCNHCSLVFDDWIDSSYKKVPRCPKCFPKTKSQGEQELLLFIKSLLGNDTDVIENNRSILKNKYELDIFIPSRKIAIEYNGLYWHSEESGKHANYHLNKMNECNKLDINLIQVFEDEFIYKRKLVERKLTEILINNIDHM